MNILIIFSVLIPIISCELPADLPVCYQDSHINQCVVENGNFGIELLAKGDRDLLIPPYDPMLKHPGAKFIKDDFQLLLSETRAFGLASLRITDANVNFETKEIVLNFQLGEPIKWQGHYQATDLTDDTSSTGNFYFIFSESNHKNVTITYDVDENNQMIIQSVIAKFENQSPKIGYHFNKMDPTLEAKWDAVKEDFPQVPLDTCAAFINYVISAVVKNVAFQDIFPLHP